MDNKAIQSAGLRSGFSPPGMWAFSIGTSIGWGSFIVTCNTYLQKSGVLGTVFGLLIGMAVIFLITWNLQYMIRNSPNAGGVYTFERKLVGKDVERCSVMSASYLQGFKFSRPIPIEQLRNFLQKA